MSRQVCALLFLFVFYSGISSLQAFSSKEVLDLNQALTIAYQQNPRIVQARKAIEGSHGDLITEKTWANPKLETEISGLRRNEEDSRKGYLGLISVKQSFDPPGVRSIGKKIKKNEIVIQQQLLKAVWSEVYFEIRSVYAKLILNEKELELNQSNLKSMRQFFSDVQVRYQSGQALKNHVQRAKIELLKAESDYLRIENDLDIDKAKLNLLLGRRRDVLFEIKDNLKEEQLVLNLEQLIEIALSKRPEMKIEETVLDSKKKDVIKEKLSRLPSYALGFQMSDDEIEKDYAVVVEVSLPLWNFNQGAVQRSKSQWEEQEVKMEAMRDEIAFEVYAAYKDAQLAVKQLGLHKQSLSAANEMFRLAGLRYGEGHIDFLNYLDQLLASWDSKMRYYQGLYQLNHNVNKLEKAVYSSLRDEVFLK